MKREKEQGFFGIGCVNMKYEVNYGSLFRSAQIFGADFIFLIGKRFKKQATDTTRSWQNIPLFQYDSFQEFNKNRPYDCKLVGIELMEEATPIKAFEHPIRACYLLGAEDHGLTKEAIQACQELIYLPGKTSLNVSVAGSIVMFDRINKQPV